MTFLQRLPLESNWKRLIIKSTSFILLRLLIYIFVVENTRRKSWLNWGKIKAEKLFFHCWSKSVKTMLFRSLLALIFCLSVARWDCIFPLLLITFLFLSDCGVIARRRHSKRSLLVDFAYSSIFSELKRIRCHPKFTIVGSLLSYVSLDTRNVTSHQDWNSVFSI